PVAAKPPTAATAKQPVAATVVDPIYSEYASDEMMAELVAQFVDDLVRDMHELEGAVTDGNLDRIHVLAHQLKGSAGSYGFGELTKPAETLERTARSAEDVSELREQVTAFQALCSRVRAPEGY
ncbi:MAG: HPt (histidine-containing phosphotransfer) domain-containing protein, partial [Planctomycetota bacterium]